MSNKFVTLLEAAGRKLKTIFTEVVPAADDVAKSVEPIVDLAFPGIATLFNATVSAVGTAEAAGQNAADITQGNNEAKLASVVSSIGPLVIAYLSTQGIPANTEHVTEWVNAVVKALNAFPAPASAQAPEASTVTVTETK